MIINTSGAIAAAATVAIMHSNRELTQPPNTLLEMILSILFACILLVLVGLIIFADEEFKKIEDNKKNEK